MRLRLLVPRGGRGRSLGGLAALAVALVLVVVLTRGEERPAPAPTPTATPALERARLDAPTQGPSLAVGITEPNPYLFAPDDVLPVAEPFRHWRDELVRMKPELYRLVIVWDMLQPDPAAPPDLAKLDLGCMRDKQPCAPYATVQDQLRALAARQREGGWQSLLVITSTPKWASGPPGGCRTEAVYGAPRDLQAYRALISSVLDLADTVGARIDYLTPWNEPNHPYFIAPQRKACDALSPSRAIAPYARLARAARAELAERGTGQLVLGEMAGILEPSSRATGVAEMIQGCRASSCARRRSGPSTPTSAAPTPWPPSRTPWRPAAARASTRSGSPRPASARHRAASRSRVGSRARRRAAGSCTGACAPGAPTRA